MIASSPRPSPPEEERGLAAAQWWWCRGARRAGWCLAAALWTAVVWAQPGPAGQTLVLQCATNQVGKYQKLEFSLQVARNYTNPFDPDEVEVNVRLTTPNGQVVTIPAFYHQQYERRRLGTEGKQRDWMYPVGAPLWRARFAPMEIGAYRAAGVAKVASGTASSEAVQFVCTPAAGRGFVQISRTDPRFLEFSEGQPFFPIGQNLAFIGSQQYVTLSRAEEIFTNLAANGANYLRVWTCCEDWAIALEARKSAWGRSWDWRAPIVPMPDRESTGARCLKLSGRDRSLVVNPSHPVALRPNTRYVVSGKVRTDGGAALQLEVQRTKFQGSFASAPERRWTAFERQFGTGPDDFWLADMRFHLEGNGTAWVSDLSLREAAGGPELLWEADVNRPVRGFYNPLDCFMVDELVAAAEKQGLYLQLCLLTRDLYMDALKDPASPEYERAIGRARKLLRYAVARWGYATGVAAWEYWNEMNPALPTDRFYAALGEYLEQVDIYHHLRTTSTWGPSAKDCRHPKLDLADAHFYLRPSDNGRLQDEVDAVLERTGWLRARAPNKPAHLGEFGLADERWRPTPEMQQSRELVDFHNALWASALSGASGTAMFWWWERLDQRGAYPVYRPLSAFIAAVPWTTGGLGQAAIRCSDERLRAMGLQTREQAWLWLFNRGASWASIVIEKRTPPTIQKAELQLEGLTTGTYRVRWWDTYTGKIIREDKRTLQQGVLRLSAPDFTRDIACQVSR